MNRLTRKTTKKDFVSKERVYYMHYDENTPEKFIEKCSKCNLKLLKKEK